MFLFHSFIHSCRNVGPFSTHIYTYTCTICLLLAFCPHMSKLWQEKQLQRDGIYSILAKIINYSVFVKWLHSLPHGLSYVLRLINNLYVRGDLCRLQFAHVLHAYNQKLGKFTCFPHINMLHIHSLFICLCITELVFRLLYTVLFNWLPLCVFYLFILFHVTIFA